jgi:hypothetical protein
MFFLPDITRASKFYQSENLIFPKSNFDSSCKYKLRFQILPYMAAAKAAKI